MGGSPETVAGAYLALLARRGVGLLFGNGGTDFAPLIEAYAEAAQKGRAVPRPILAAHENLAVTMGHGYGMVSRRVPAVMVHVSVGTANMVCPAMIVAGTAERAGSGRSRPRGGRDRGRVARAGAAAADHRRERRPRSGRF